MLIVPFRIKNTWYGFDINNVKAVETCGKISLVSATSGLMQKNGKILPIMSLYPDKNDILHCLCYIEITHQDKSIAVPADEILPVAEIFSHWVPAFKNGIKMYRSLDKKAPQTNQSEKAPANNMHNKDFASQKDYQEII